MGHEMSFDLSDDSVFACPYCEAPAPRIPKHQMTCKKCGNRSYIRAASFYDHVLVTGYQAVVIDYLAHLSNDFSPRLAGHVGALKHRIYDAGADWDLVLQELESSIETMLELTLVTRQEFERLARTAFWLGGRHMPLLSQIANATLDGIATGHQRDAEAESRNPWGLVLRPPSIWIRRRGDGCAFCEREARHLRGVPLEDMLALRPLPHSGCTHLGASPGFCRCEYTVYAPSS